MVDAVSSSPGKARKAGTIVDSAREFIKFGIVGGSGVLVNLLVVFIATKSFSVGWGIHENDVFFNLFGTRWNIRWYHVIMTIAFVVANTWNYQLNRSWTFKNVPKRSWLRGFFPFLTTGIVAFVVSQTVATLLMNPTSPIALPDHIFDGSTGLRTKFYWSAGISTLVAMPVNFIINKLWTFGRPKVIRIETVETV
ncbi:GtrA family protein [Corynebacterium sp. MSK044]|uniref:GtrA family protein n=1 Tax=Corynebacterium sp. MSK044 TaxID=3050195 RepID=UPI0025504495|nr:GtrA family protein [Corynebacterium sp. MSK044]MDK8797615.1 GtrA family protein [Corynebacterium sp. MSK044]